MKQTNGSVVVADWGGCATPFFWKPSDAGLANIVIGPGALSSRSLPDLRRRLGNPYSPSCVRAKHLGDRYRERQRDREREGERGDLSRLRSGRNHRLTQSVRGPARVCVCLCDTDREEENYCLVLSLSLLNVSFSLKSGTEEETHSRESEIVYILLTKKWYWRGNSFEREWDCIYTSH